jgi:hypothetical protein
MKKWIFVFLLLLLILYGCNNQDFSPYAVLEKKVVIYGIFDNRLQNQYIRIQSTYLSDDLKKNISKINLNLTEQFGNSYTLRDTILDPNSNYRIFYIPNYNLKRGITYRLVMTYDSLIEHSETYIPPVTQVSSVMSLDTITTTGKTPSTEVYFTFRISIPKTAPIINAIRIYINYNKKENGVNNNYTVQVPISSPQLSTTGVFEYSQFDFIQLSDFSTDPVQVYYSDPVENWKANYYKDGGSSWNVTIPISYMFYTFDQIGKGSNPEDITIKSAYIVSYALDQYYFDNYFSTSSEAYSVRLDNPVDLTNIASNQNNPIGYFGWVTADTAKFKIISYFMDKYKFNDGQ